MVLDRRSNRSTKEGVIKVRDVRSMEEKEAWNVGRFNDVRRTPWESIPGREDIEIKSRVVIPVDRTGPRQLIEGEETGFTVRRMRITREFIRKVGFTIGCPACRAVNFSQPAVNHNEECRRRIEGMLREQGNENILRSEERIKERNEERDNKRRRMADGNQGNAARGGVNADGAADTSHMSGDGGAGTTMDICRVTSARETIDICQVTAAALETMVETRR